MESVIQFGAAHLDRVATAASANVIGKTSDDLDDAHAMTMEAKPTQGDEAGASADNVGIQISDVAVEEGGGASFNKPFAYPGVVYCKNCELHWPDESSSPKDLQCPRCKTPVLVFKARIAQTVAPQGHSPQGPDTDSDEGSEVVVYTGKDCSLTLGKLTNREEYGVSMPLVSAEFGGERSLVEIHEQDEEGWGNRSIFDYPNSSEAGGNHQHQDPMEAHSLSRREF